MKFRIVKKTASGNLLLQSDENKPLERKMLYVLDRRDDSRQTHVGKRVAMVFDTIATTKKPFYLAKPLNDKVEGILVDSK